MNINQCLAQGGQVLQKEVMQKQGGKQEAINAYCAQVPEIVQTARAIKAQLEGGGNFQQQLAQAIMAKEDEIVNWKATRDILRQDYIQAFE